MRTRPFSATKGQVSLPSGDDARTRTRPTGDIPRFFTIAQVAELMGVSTRSVRRWIDDGLLIAHRFRGAVRIAEPDLRAFIALHRGG
jgi:excisionase family DNA binding protein